MKIKELPNRFTLREKLERLFELYPRGFEISKEEAEKLFDLSYHKNIYTLSGTLRKIIEKERLNCKVKIFKKRLLILKGDTPLG